MMGRMILAGMLTALLVVPAGAQVASGPLADPGAVAEPSPVARARTPRAKAKGGPARTAAGKATGKRSRKAAAALPRTPAETAPGAGRDAPTSAADRRANADAGDPVSFGMKWNGSNDTAEKTRVQNYDGNAAGTGAEVGFKLHF